MADLLDRVFGFIPDRAVFWSGLSTFLFAMVVKLTHNWVKNKTELPWMRKENQQKRREVLNKRTNSSIQENKKEEIQ